MHSFGNYVEKRAWTEVDLGRLINNYRIYKSMLGESARVMAVVKADAYGHGDIEVARALEGEGISLFAVSNIDEAIRLREGGVLGEILILGYTSPSLSDLLEKHDIMQTLVSEEHAEDFARVGSKARFQFAVDTGMKRIGLDARHTHACADVIKKYSDRLRICGVFTHLCVADSQKREDVEFTRSQISAFGAVCERIEELGLEYIHCLNSAGGLLHRDALVPEVLLGTVRLGIVLYGLAPDVSVSLPEGIQPALSWKATVSMVKEIESGETVGYGRTYVADGRRKIATVTVGYADGYPRALSNRGYVLIDGKRARIVGRVCMDQITVDVTDIPSVRAGDVATLLGESGDEVITASDIAELIGTIGYEIVCGISKRVRRIYV